jgi:hypothetical protein
LEDLMFRRLAVAALTVSLAVAAHPGISEAKPKKPAPKPAVGQVCPRMLAAALDATGLAWQVVALPYGDAAANAAALSAFPAVGSTNRNFIPTAFLSPSTDLALWGTVAVYGYIRPDAFSGYSTAVMTDPTGTNFFTIFKGLAFSLEIKPGVASTVDDQQAFLASFRPVDGVSRLGGTVPAIRWNVEENGFDYTAFVVGSHFVIMATLPDETLGMINQVMAANGQPLLTSLDAPTA